MLRPRVGPSRQVWSLLVCEKSGGVVQRQPGHVAFACGPIPTSVVIAVCCAAGVGVDGQGRWAAGAEHRAVTGRDLQVRSGAPLTPPPPAPPHLPAVPVPLAF
eukprot:360357-Chlamydomonas_euryale.AAC.2